MNDIVERLRKHVNDRGGPSIANGAWEMMLEAADEIERLREALKFYATDPQCGKNWDFGSRARTALCSGASARMEEPPSKVTVVPNSEQAKTEVEG